MAQGNSGDGSTVAPGSEEMEVVRREISDLVRDRTILDSGGNISSVSRAALKSALQGIVRLRADWQTNRAWVSLNETAEDGTSNNVGVSSFLLHHLAGFPDTGIERPDSAAGTDAGRVFNIELNGNAYAEILALLKKHGTGDHSPSAK